MGQFEEGHNLSKGRKAGSKNKVTVNIRDAFDFAFEKSGSKEALAAWAKDNRKEFYQLYSRLAPAHLNITDRRQEDFVEGLAERELIKEAEVKMLEAQGEVVGEPEKEDTLNV